MSVLEELNKCFISISFKLYIMPNEHGPLSDDAYLSNYNTTPLEVTLNTSVQMREEINGSLDNDSHVTNGIEEITFIYPAPILITLGIITNVLILLVLRKPGFRNISLCTFLGAYSISNILALVLNSGVEWMSDVFIGTHFYNSSEAVCRIWQFLIRVVTYSGGWFMVSMTIDRFLNMWFPKKANGLCSVFFAKTVITFVIVGLTIISAHALWLFRLTERGTHTWCYIDTYSSFYTHFWLVLGMQFSVVPLCLILFFGILAGVGVRRRSRFKTIMSERIRMDITLSTIFNAMLYFLLNAPATVINVIDNFSPREWLESIPVINNMEVARDISQCLVLISYASGIIVWILCSHSFRCAIKEVFTRKPKPNRTSVNSVTSYLNTEV